MKKNNKGFTIVELLAVLVILITILLIAIPSITSTVERNKQNMLKKKYELFEAAGESFVSLYKNRMNYTGFVNEECAINLSNLKSVGLLTDDDLLDNDNNVITGYILYDDGNYTFNSTISEEMGECILWS